LVPTAPQPSTEAQQAARERAARDAQSADQIAQQRRSQQTALAQQQQQTQQQQREQRKADCSFLQGEIQSVHRMRNLLVNRPYYSLDDLEQMDRHAEQLVADYRRVCTN
jgi:sensor histidine kinase YesM